MPGEREASGPSPLARHLAGLLVYHALLVAAFLYVPGLPGTPADRVRIESHGDLRRAAEAAPRVADLDAVWHAVIGIVGALAVMVPIAWIYVLTRRRKGFSQAIVHTLLILPVAVAGVVVIVKDSLALAFALAGIAASVRFRNTLDDTKDAVYILLATGVGIAAAVGELGVGFVVTVLFDAVVLVLWWTDFGRAPVGLEGSPAYRRLERARTSSERGGDFVQTLDRELLSDLSTPQLDALSKRAWQRRQLRDDRPRGARRFPYNAVLRVHTTSPDVVQGLAEGVLELYTKTWELSGTVPGEAGWTTLEYLVRVRKSQSPDELLTALKMRAAPHTVGVELKS